MTEVISKHGAEAAKRKSRNAELAIDQAMAAIEKDIECNGGIYPFANGVISSAEVLRRANLSPAALQKGNRHEVREKVKAWVAGIRSKQARGIKVVRRSVTERVDQTREEMLALQQAWAEAEIEYVRTQREHAQLKQTLDLIRAENARLRDELADMAIKCRSEAHGIEADV